MNDFMDFLAMTQSTKCCSLCLFENGMNLFENSIFLLENN